MNIQWNWTGGEFTPVPAGNLFHSSAQAADKHKQRPHDYLPGHHSIGFRIVQADWPATKPYPEKNPFLRDCVVQQPSMISAGPDPEKPWYRRRNLIPMPPTDIPGMHSWLSGLPMGFGPHIHNSALEICPNGDLLVTLYTAPMGPRGEDQPEVQLLGSRLRYGTLAWDMPEFFQYNSDVKLGSVCFSRIGDQIWFLDGHSGYDRHYPFQWMTSDDNGATWSTPHFPQIIGDIGPYDPHPKNQILIDKQGNLYVPSDGKVSSSLLWVSPDHGKTWRDTGGRTLGRHSVFQFLNDGRILGMGGKSADIDGYMPQNISSDSGKTWQISKSVFAALGGNQRPCLIRLQSGKLFMCGDFQTRSGRHPQGKTEHGSYVALSRDEGENWVIKVLPGTLPHFKDNLYPTIGYSIARQAENGIIHLVATATLPLLHYEINEAWIMYETADWPLTEKPRVTEIQAYREFYPSGAIMAIRRGGIDSDGRYLLQGLQEWFYEDGGKKWEVNYLAGKKTGRETFWYPDGSVKFKWQHNTDGTSVWTQYWSNGQKKAESSWRNDRAEGTAQRWDRNGQLIGSGEFYNGRIYQTKDP